MEQPKQQLYMPAEWHDQQMVQLTWPHEKTDWHYMLDEVEACYVQLAAAICSREHLLIVTPDIEKVRALLKKNNVATSNITFFECDTNDIFASGHQIELAGSITY